MLTALLIADNNVASSTAVLVCFCVLGLFFAALYAWQVMRLPVDLPEDGSEALQNSSTAEEDGGKAVRVSEIQDAVREGSQAFLMAEYKILAVFIVVMFVIVLVVVGSSDTNCTLITYGMPDKSTTGNISYSKASCDNGPLTTPTSFSDCASNTKPLWANAALSAVAFLLGGITSIASGYIGMMIATEANGRTAIQASIGIGPAFVTAFKAGCVMGFALVALGIVVLLITIALFRMKFAHDTTTLPYVQEALYEYALSYKKYLDDLKNLKIPSPVVMPWDNNQCMNVNGVTQLFECVAAYGLGGSSIALFGRVGGGIYTKAADVGSDLVGKIEAGIPEDDPRNPGTIADNVGDNVGDIAGMGADLFGSFAEATCATLVISSYSDRYCYQGIMTNCIGFDTGTLICRNLTVTPAIATMADLAVYMDTTCSGMSHSWSAMLFPMLIIALGIVVSILGSFVATDIWVVRDIDGIEPSLKRQLLISTIVMTPLMYVICYVFLPETLTFNITPVVPSVVSFPTMYTAQQTSPAKIYGCIASGLWAGLITGYITEYFTSHSYTPVREVAEACKTGAATNVIYGLALGYKSVIIPVIALTVSVFLSLRLAGFLGVACAAIGILSIMAICLTIDAYGPISDNAGGIAEMARMGKEVRRRTDALDAAGNTTAAIGKGFAIGSAALVSLALFSAYCTRCSIEAVNVTQPFQFSGVLIGAMLPYWFSAMTMKSVGKAAMDMVDEIRRQFREIPGIMDYTAKPDYKRCVEISTKASLREMIAPGALVMLSPLIVGFVFGKMALAGLLIGAMVSSVQLAISASNTGGAWDNAKKYIEAGLLIDPEESPEARALFKEYKSAAVIGDTIGDPLKDTSGPSLNILMKLMAIISVVFAPAISSHGGLNGYIFKILGDQNE